MDRQLIWGTILALIIETTWLLDDLKIIEIPFFHKEEIRSVDKSVGSVQVIKKNVRRRGQDSIVWEDTTENDLVYSYDSILTLPESSATISMFGDTRITMSENTLILVEPIQNETQAKIRIRFAKGDMTARRLTKDTEIQAQEWTVDATAGSEITLRQSEEGKVEVEVIRGEANLRNKRDEVKNLEQGHVLSLHEDKIVEEKKIVDSIKWITESGTRLYSFNFPISMEVKWQGDAEKIWHLDPQKRAKTYQLEKNQNSLVIPFSAGTHLMRLMSSGTTSNTISVNAWAAPTIHLFNPLPRDRIRLGEEMSFSWKESAAAKSYKIQFSDKEDFSNVLSQVPVDLSYKKISLKREGLYFWRVIGIDEKGYEIPALYSNPIYNFNELLEAPVIKPPRARQPASKQEGAMFFWKWFLPFANAGTGYDVLFEWEPVSGAEHYMLEIDREGSFRNPILMVKVENSKFFWTGTALGKYYWRVAAGRGTTMGKFSSPQFLDLAKVLVDAKLGEEQGVSVKPTSPTPVPPPPTPVAPLKTRPPVATAISPTRPAIAEIKKVSPPPESPQINVETPPKVEVPAPIVEPPVSPPEKIVNTRPPKSPPASKINFITKWSGRAYGGLAYEIKKLSTTSSTQVSFSDILPIMFGLELNSKFSAQSELNMRLNYNGNKWKPKTESALPLQDKIDDQNLRAEIFLSKEKSKVNFGLTFSQLSLIKRVGYDQVDFDKQFVIGPGLTINANWKSWSSRHTLAISSDFANRNLYEFYSSNLWFYEFGVSRKSKFEFILQGNVFYQISSGLRDSWGVQIGPALGVSW